MEPKSTGTSISDGSVIGPLAIGTGITLGAPIVYHTINLLCRINDQSPWFLICPFVTLAFLLVGFQRLFRPNTGKAVICSIGMQSC